jgi:hypothetical protein
MTSISTSNSLGPMRRVTCHHCGFRDPSICPGQPEEREYVSTMIPGHRPRDVHTPGGVYIDTVWEPCYPGNEIKTYYCRKQGCWYLARGLSVVPERM